MRRAIVSSRTHTREQVVEHLKSISVVNERGCILLNAGTPDGYSKVTYDNVQYRGHVFVYETLKGPVPPGKQLAHQCHTPACINEEHMEPMTPLDNTGQQPRVISRRCKRGHLLEGDNLYVHPRGGWRQCKACQNLRTKEYRRRKKC